MKRLILTLIVFACTASVSVVAQGGPPSWAGKGQGRNEVNKEGPEDLIALDRFLSMSDSQLDQLMQAISKVRAMTPAQRTAMKKQMAEYRNLSPEQREQVRTGWGWLNEEDRSDWPLMMHSKSDAERAAIQTEIQNLTADKRAARKHALLEDWRKAAAK